MATTLQKLRDQGWHLSEDGLKKLAGEDYNGTDVRQLVKLALDVDLREICNKTGGLASEHMKSSKLETGNGGAVVQVMGVRNVSAPKSNEESKTAPRMLQFDLTDGQNVCLALEFESIQCLSINTAPGTKLLLKGNIKMSQGMLMLGPSNVSVAGGQVVALFERWENARIMAKYSKGIQPNQGAGGPPPWITFGQKSVQQQTMSKEAIKFKSLTTEAAAESKENAEFTAMRSKAIAQANAERTTKKVFGGGKRNLIDHNVKKIIDKGFTDEEAQSALRYAKNNLERAMGQLKRERLVAAGLAVSAAPEPHGGGGGRGGRRGFGERRGRGGGEEEQPEAAKPSGRINLFEFLSNKIPLDESIPITSSSSVSTPFTQPAKPFSQPASSAPSTNNNFAKRSDEPFNNNQRRNDNQPPRRTNNDGPKGGRGSKLDDKKPDSELPHNQRRSDNNQQRRPNDSGPKGYPNQIDEILPKKSDHVSEPRRTDNNPRRPNNNDGPKGYPNKIEEIKPRTGPPRSENGIARPSTSSKPSNGNAEAFNRGSSSATSTSSTSTKTVSANNPFSLENRAKFQNDISSSFANRGKRTEEPARKDNKPASSVRHGDVPPKAREAPPKTNEFAKPNQSVRKPIDVAPRNSSRPSKFDAQPYSGVEKGKPVTKDSQQHSLSKQPPVNQRAKSDAKPRESPAVPQENKVAQLVKAAAALTVSEPSRPKPSKSTPAIGAAAATTTTTLKTPILTSVFPNGYEFNPNKIMGFTDKESNEVAQSLLKAANGSSDMLSQLLEAASAASNRLAAQSSLSPLPEAFVPAAVAQQSPVKVPNQQYSVRPMTSPQHHPRQQQPQPHYEPQMQHVPQFASPHPTQFNRPLAQNDACFAKYWEDGRYYHAVITGIHLKTYVVKFVEYGNYEELLISDCLPVTDENIQLVNQYNNGLALQPNAHYPLQHHHHHHHQQQQQQIVQPAHQQPQYVQTLPTQQLHQQPGLLQTPQHHQPTNSYQQQMDYNQYNQQQQQHLQRMRGERQMYVPPAQRSSK